MADYPEFKESGQSTTLGQIGDAFEDISERIGNVESKFNADGTSTPPVATKDTIGGVKPGIGLTVTDDGTLNAEEYTLPAAKADTLGGVKVGNGINVSDDGTIDVQALIDRIAALETAVAELKKS